MPIIIVSLILLACSWWLTGAVRRYALTSQLVDVPNERSSHTRVTPSGGGLAIVFVFIASIALLLGLQQIELPLALAIIGGGGMIAAIGYIDDRRDISPQVRIIVHFAATLWLVALVQGSPTLNLGPFQIDTAWLVYPIEIIGIMWCINLYNFMDGIDGLAGGQAIFVGIAGAVLFILSGSNSVFGLVSWLLAIASIGFLLWNYPPARIFMGDVGSGFLGFIIAGLIVISIHQTDIPVLSWVILMAAFVVDSTFTLLRRMLRGEKWYSAHRSHAYQHATQRFQKHSTVTLWMMIINVVWLMPLAILTLYYENLSILLLLVAIFPLLILCVYFRAGSQSGESKR